MRGVFIRQSIFEGKIAMKDSDSTDTSQAPRNSPPPRLSLTGTRKRAALLAVALIAGVAALVALAVPFSPEAAQAQTGGPTVSAVAVSSDAGADSAYALDEIIRVTLTFSEAVEATGSPRLKIDMDPADWGEKWAVYESGGGTASLTFAHTVVEPNLSTQGIAVVANTLELNDGAIRSASSQTAADLSHAGLGHDASHKVDWRLSPPPPAVSGVAATSDAGADDTYALGETIRLTLTFS